jgi:glycosyltransferase involved in cell wall biosynthesis
VLEKVKCNQISEKSEKKVKNKRFLTDISLNEKKYVKNFRWAIHGFLSNFGVRNSNFVLVPTASAYLDCITFLNVRDHKKIKYLSTPINCEYWDGILSIGTKKLEAKKFIFHPAGTKPSKNTSKAIEAFKQMKIDDLYFVCLTNATNSEKDTPKVYDSSVIYLSDITDNEMKWLYQNCLFISVVSIEEGTGLPVLEAQHFKKLIVTSFISALPEVAGINEIFTNPFDVDAIKKAYLLAYKQTIMPEELSRDSKAEYNRYGNECLLEIKKIFESRV